MKATVTLLTLQEAIKRAQADGLINSGTLIFYNNNLVIEGKGVELPSTKKTDVANKIDNTMAFHISYPVISTPDPGRVNINNYSNLLSKLGAVFEKDDLLTVESSEAGIKFSRENPPREIVITTVADEFIYTIFRGKERTEFLSTEIIFYSFEGAPLRIPLTNEIIADSAQLREMASISSSLSSDNIPLKIEGNKVKFILSGKDFTFNSEIKIDKIQGDNITVNYPTNLRCILNVGFGLATIRLSPQIIYVKFENKNQVAEYIISAVH